jgi:hypothetical protein
VHGAILTHRYDVCDVTGQQGGWLLYNSGVVVALTVHPIEGPFVRGVPYVWCKAAHDRNGNSGVYPTAPLFGRFISQAKDGPNVLAGRGKSAVVGAEYVYCFRAVGMIGRDADQYARSEIPVPIPSAAVRQDQPAAFDLLQHGVKALDNALQAMANVTELIDDVDEADKRSDNDKYLDRRYRKAQAYEALDDLLTTALDKSETLQKRLADYHKVSPELAHWLSRWQSDDAKT